MPSILTAALIQIMDVRDFRAKQDDGARNEHPTLCVAQFKKVGGVAELGLGNSVHGTQDLDQQRVSVRSDEGYDSDFV